MILESIEIIPKKSLPRFQPDKRYWLDPVDLQIESIGNCYKVSFWSSRGQGRRMFSVEVPVKIDFNDRMKMALTAYMCEGTNLRKGIYTENSGNKGKNICFSNTNPWLLKLIVDEFEKVGIKREFWSVRLQIFSQHLPEEEKSWWSSFLSIPLSNFSIREVSKGDPTKIDYARHGLCLIEIWSVVYASIIDNLIRMVQQNNL